MIEATPCWQLKHPLSHPPAHQLVTPLHPPLQPPLQEVVDESQYHLYPSWVPTFESVAARPSVYPKRSFCKITGLIGKYKCPVTGDYLATLPAFETHRETRLKGLI